MEKTKHPEKNNKPNLSCPNPLILTACDIPASRQEKMRGQRGRLPVQSLGYVMSTKAIFRRAEVFRDVRMQANLGPMFERK